MMLFNRRTALKLGLATGATLAASRAASALVEVNVSGGNFQPLPIAIPDFASSDPAFGQEIAGIVRNNLQRSGLFLPLDPASLPIRVGDVAATPNFDNWRQINVDALVMGQVERGGQIQSSVRVWDTQQAAQVVGKRYNTDPNRLAAGCPHYLGRDLRVTGRWVWLFRYTGSLRGRERPEGQSCQAAGDHGSGWGQLAVSDRRPHAGADAAFFAQQ
ncbi:hypothetical protein PSQ19_09695 [Devosia algicola]|uniref:TolB N-terminal domain-containing protein n=1 Tax=Devosia algicola TaxID=3026418 RepID=A0ABY7YIS2_9HYPH|nr:hypothetical protein [Devosia algicola]WDR01161.1 hypothetical protein PSQ19_09695 [Devosia algicola]